MSLRSIMMRCVLRKNPFVNFAPLALENLKNERQDNYERYRKYQKITATALLSSILIGSTATEDKRKDKGTLKAEDVHIEAGERRLDLPTYRAEEVSKHDSKDSFWVIYKHGVYDVTKFLSSHPGGEQILNAGGLSIEPFWNVYGMHKTQDVYKILESYRIGNLHADDLADYTDAELWAREPRRDPRLVVKTQRPFNAEIPPHLQIQHFDTPNELFYVRQHMPVPEIDAATHTLKVVVKSPSGTRVREFSLRELDAFPQVSLRAALMCAGNRRTEMHEQVKPVKGISWTTGAISSAVWTGVRMRDFLIHCGVDPHHTEGLHVVMRGADVDATGEQFSTSVPLEAALGDALLATRMNGAPLPPDHGAPLRALLPGAPAVRSVKWLESITVSEEESPSHWHQKDYRSFNASVTWETADFASAPPVYSVPVTSAVCRAEVTGGALHVSGYAYSGGGAKIVRVDVSSDGGGSWAEAELRASDAAPPPRHYAWTLWDAALPLPEGTDEVEVWVKATDSNFNTQPEHFDHIWNIRGILANAYHKVKVRVH